MEDGDTIQEFTAEALARRWSEFFSISRNRANIEATATTYPDTRSVTVDMRDLAHHDREMAEHLHRHPLASLTGAREALRDHIPPDLDEHMPLHVRVTDADYGVRIRDIRDSDYGKLVTIDGIVQRVPPVRPLLVLGVYKCSRCGALMRVRQKDDRPQQEPFECSRDDGVYVSEPGCGRAARDCGFDLVQEESTYLDHHSIRIQEAPEDLGGGTQPESVTLHMVDDIAGIVTPGDRARVVGIPQRVQRTKRGKPLNEYDLRIRVISISILHTSFRSLTVTDEMRGQVEELSRNPNALAILTRCIAPSIHGMMAEKRALLLQAFGGVRKQMPDGSIVRGDSHILLIGDPGTGKSQLLKFMRRLVPHGVAASGKSASGPGLVAAVVKDDDGVMGLEAGALVLANEGGAYIDELDKMRASDRDSIHVAMEQQEVDVHKGGIHATVYTRCYIAAAANPKLGSFHPYDPLPAQVQLSTTILSRFDLVLPIIDVPNKDVDRERAEHIVGAHMDAVPVGADEEKEARREYRPPFTAEFVRSYIAESHKINPVLTPAAHDILVANYREMRGAGERDGITPTTARTLEGGIRLSESAARARLSSTVDEVDAQVAVDLIQAGFDMLSRDGDALGAITGVPQREVAGWVAVLHALKAGPDGGMTLDELDGQVMTMEKDDIQKTLKRLHDKGEIINPPTGKWRML